MAATQILDTSKDRWSDADARITVAHIGKMNVLAISGGRVYDSGHGVILPVSNGYKVTVDLAPNDTYTVRRIRLVGFHVELHGEMTGIYDENVGEVAYEASCFENGPFGYGQED
jgi:hypothetical protein